MLIFGDLTAILKIKGDSIQKIVICKLFFKQKCHIFIHNINSQREVIGDFGLHRLIFVLL